MPENFSAAYALAFCAGAFFPKKLAWILPLGTLLITDTLLNIFHYHTAPFNLYMIGNYAAYAGIILLGRAFSGKPAGFKLSGGGKLGGFASWLTLLCGGIVGALVFYVVTNTFSWILMPEYAKTFAGWIQALTVGTPGWPHTWEFFRSTLMSGGLFTGLFAGAMKFSEALEPSEAEEPEPEPAESESEESPA